MHPEVSSNVKVMVESIVDQVRKGNVPIIIRLDKSRKVKLSFGNPKSVKKIGTVFTSKLKFVACILRVLELAARIDKKTTLTKRDVFYMDTQLFGSQLVVDKILDGLATNFFVPRDKLGIVSTCKGFAYGELRVVSTDGNCINFDGCRMVSQLADEKSLITSSPSIVLIVEKEAVFNSLCQLQPILRQKIPSLLLVTGRGYPCMSTLQFVNWLYRQLDSNVKFLALVDYDPYGLDIAMRYRAGSKLPADQSSTCCPRLELLGVTLDDIDNFSNPTEPDNSRQPFGKRSHLVMKRVKSEAEKLHWKSMVKAVQDMEIAGFCTEIESVYKNDMALLSFYICNKINK